MVFTLVSASSFSKEMTAGQGFIALAAWLSDAEFLAWGWRVPFLASATLVIVGLYVRLALAETVAYQRVAERRAPDRAGGGVVNAGEHRPARRSRAPLVRHAHVVAQAHDRGTHQHEVGGAQRGAVIGDLHRI
mgnify:CR=1 FL=1